MEEIRNTAHKIQIVLADDSMLFYLTFPYSDTLQFLTYLSIYKYAKDYETSLTILFWPSGYALPKHAFPIQTSPLVLLSYSLLEL